MSSSNKTIAEFPTNQLASYELAAWAKRMLELERDIAAGRISDREMISRDAGMKIELLSLGRRFGL